jgi:hypothetical protein
MANGLNLDQFGCLHRVFFGGGEKCSFIIFWLETATTGLIIVFPWLFKCFGVLLGLFGGQETVATDLFPLGVGLPTSAVWAPTCRRHGSRRASGLGMAKDGFNLAKDDPKMAQKWTKMVARCPRHGSA